MDNSDLPSRITKMLQRTLRGIAGRRAVRATTPNGPNGKSYPGDDSNHKEPGEPVITEAEQVLLDRRERAMLQAILHLEDATVREVMVPRVDIVAVDISSPLEEVVYRMVERGHSRLPVYSRDLDNIEGVVHARDLLPILASTGERPPLKEIIRPAFFVPESKRLDELLQELQEKYVQIALVVDEYGGIEGLVTLEDLLEEIVGEIEDEFSYRHQEPMVVPVDNGDLMVDARVTLDYISDLMAVQVPDSMAGTDTIGAFVYSELGKVPELGDQVELEGLNVRVASLLGRRIRKLRVGRPSP